MIEQRKKQSDNHLIIRECSDWIEDNNMRNQWYNTRKGAFWGSDNISTLLRSEQKIAKLIVDAKIQEREHSDDQIINPECSDWTEDSEIKSRC
jgi:hypothetical protein